MKKIKILIFSVLILLCFAACSLYNVKKEINNKDYLTSVDDVLIVLRIPHSSRVEYEKYISNFKIWKNGYQSEHKIIIYEKNQTDENSEINFYETLTTYKDSSDRFYQESAGNDYLKYKTLGMIKSYGADNRENIQKLLNEYGVKNVLFYEISGAFSPNLKAMYFNSVMVLVDNKFNIEYLDHQDNTFSELDYHRDDVEKEFIDHISRRLYESLTDMGYVTAL